MADTDEVQGRSISGFGSRSSRPVRQRPSFRRNSFKNDRTNDAPNFKPRTSFSRNRFRSRNENRFESSQAKSDEETTPAPSFKKSIAAPKLSKPKSNFDNEDPKLSKPNSNFDNEDQKNNNPVTIKKFNKFDRPDFRKTLLNKLFEKRPEVKARFPVLSKNLNKDDDESEEATEASNDETEEDGDLDFPDDHESAPSALVPSIVDDEDILQNIDNEEIRLERLLTTLQVSSIYPKELSDEYLEVATIRSPYTFNIEDNEKSTRFITITKSFTKALDITPTKSFTSSISSTIPISEINPSSSKPLFDTNSIPAPENILASTSTPYETINIQGSSDVEYLSPLTLTSSLHLETPPLKTVTETLSTVETLIKKSLLPVIAGEESSIYTLTQTYSVTRIVTAVKTVPPMELYEFNPQQSFADFDALFEEAGSERRESLLPGELEFSDQDNFGLEGPSVIKVAPPSDFVEDLDLIGSKFDFVDEMEKYHNPDIIQLKGSQTPNLDSSFSSQNPLFGNAPQQSHNKKTTPSLPDNGLAALGITPEQLLYLQLLQNPLAALGIGGVQQQQQVIIVIEHKKSFE